MIRYLGGDGNGETATSPMNSLSGCLSNDGTCYVTNDYSRDFGSITFSLRSSYKLGSTRSSSEIYFILTMENEFTFTINSGITYNIETLHVYFIFISKLLDLFSILFYFIFSFIYL
jgi:hypothetical protein